MARTVWLCYMMAAYEWRQSAVTERFGDS